MLLVLMHALQHTASVADNLQIKKKKESQVAAKAHGYFFHPNHLYA
jgi:hypothetical protein